MAAPPFSAAEPRRSASPSPSTATTQPRQESMASSVFATRVAERGPAPPQVWENTYKLRDPDAPSSFNKSAVAAIIQSKLSSRLEKMEYDPATAAGVANELSTSIKDAVKASGLGRYKLIVHVTLCQRCGQSMRLGSRCLWDAGSDNFVSESFENDSLFASAQAFALYVE